MLTPMPVEGQRSGYDRWTLQNMWYPASEGSWYLLVYQELYCSPPLHSSGIFVPIDWEVTGTLFIVCTFDQLGV